MRKLHLFALRLSLTHATPALAVRHEKVRGILIVS
jgi:hypothetical protein